MAAREPERGDVYYVRFDDSWGSEEAVGRPIVVVSNNKGNSATSIVTGLSLTTAPRSAIMAVLVKSTNRPSYVLCNQIRTYDKFRLNDYMCSLTREEMAQIDNRLALNLGLEIMDDTIEEKFKQEIEVAVAQVSAQLAEKDKEIVDLKEKCDKEIAELKEKCLEYSIESDVNLRLYEKAIEMLCEKKLAADTNPVEEPKVAEKPQEAPPVEPELVDLNNCTAKDLVNIGFDNRVAKMIIANRPFANVDELRYVDGVTKIGFKLAEKKVTVGWWKPPVEKKKPVVEEKKPAEKPDKININTATVEEMVEYAGINDKTAKAIRAYRNKHGKFVSLDDLLNVNRWGPKCAIKYNDKLTV